MYRRHIGRIAALVGALMIGAMSVAWAAQPAPQAAPQQVTRRAYMPMALQRSVRPQTIFGVEMTSIASDRGFAQADALGISMIRRNGLLWKDVEPVEGGGYNWNAPSVKQIEQELINAAERNIQVVLTVRASPRWATAPAQNDCAPINSSKYGSFANFMAAVAQRYGAPPYNLAYVEIFNEPDLASTTVDQPFGCWANTNDEYNGGRAYGEMLKVVYPRIKATNPNIQVMNGGLGLIRPYSPPTFPEVGARFIEGVFVAGAANSFDIVNYHGYCYYGYTGPFAGSADGGDNRGQSCATDWKAPYLREVMRRYNVAEKPLFNTEAALLCDPTTDVCQQKQADFAGRQYARAIKDRLAGQLWYIFDSDSFRNTALIDPNNPTVTRPAYAAYKQAATQLGESRFGGTISGLPANVIAHQFLRPDATVISAWSDAPQTVAIPVRAGASVTCSNRDGAAVACSNAGGSVTIAVGSGPTYIVVR